MRSNMLQTVLNDLNGTSADIEASAIISSDGLMMAALLPNTVDEDRVGAMSAAMLSLGDRTARELSRGNLDQVLILIAPQDFKIADEVEAALEHVEKEKLA